MSITSTIELYEQTREGSADARVGTMTRRFLVPAPRESALAFPGVPTVGSSYVFNGRTLRCDRLDVSGTPDPAVSEVTAAYSSDGRFSFQPKVDRTENNFARWSLSTTIQTRKVPSFIRKTIEVPNPDVPGTMMNARVWDRDDMQVEVPITTFSSTVVLDQYDNAVMNAILSQVGLIHQFGTFPINANTPYAAFWKFKGHRASRIAEDKFEVTYDWYADHGNLGFFVLPESVVPPPDGGEIAFIFGTSRLICPTGRNQFEEYLVIAPEDPFGTPGVALYQPYKSFLTTPLLKSFRDLPGDPIGGNP